MVTEEQVREALKNVYDPEIMINVVDLGLVYKIEIQDKEVTVDLGLTTPFCPAGPQLIQQAKQAIEALESDLKANVRLTLDPPWTPDRMSEEARNQLGIF
jgi:metal-sulfur cluster biosynthetic enzyme